MQRFEALRLPVFRHLAAAYVINEFGTWIGDIALAILVFDRTGSPLATALLFVALRFIPGFIGPPLTTRLEVISPRQILASLYIGEAVIFAVIAAFPKTFSLPAFLGLAALDGIFAVTAKSLIRSVNATVLKDGNLLRQGIAIINLGVTAGGALGPAVAGALVATEGAGAALAVDAASFAVVALIIVTTSGLRLRSDTARGSWERLTAGVSQAWQRPPVRRLLMGAAVTLLFGAAVIPIEVVFAKRTLHAGDAGYGLLIASWGLGSVGGGAFAVASARARLAVIIGASVAAMGGAYAGLAASPSLAVACAFSLVGGVGNGLWVAAILSALQEGTPDNAQAAVMSVFEGINQIMPGVGYIMGGVITAIGSTRIAYAVGAAGILTVLVAQLVRPITGAEILPTEKPFPQRVD